MPLVLDFDLDYFNSISTFNTEFSMAIKPIIQKAEVITIAREPYWFEVEKSEERKYTWEDALVMLLSQIKEALA